MSTTNTTTPTFPAKTAASPPRVTPHSFSPSQEQPYKQEILHQEQDTISIETIDRGLAAAIPSFDVDKFFEEGIMTCGSQDFAASLQKPRAIRHTPPFVIHKCFSVESEVGYLYSVGLHAKGFPEFFACGVSKERIHVVEKNMAFLSNRVLSGCAVEGGHLSTDSNYRVYLVEIAHEDFRTFTVQNYLHGMNAKARVIELLPYYRDAEEWGAFPPAPQGQVSRRNKIIESILFPDVAPVTFDWQDAEYVFSNMVYFARLVLATSGDQVQQRLPAGLRPLFEQYSLEHFGLPSKGGTKGILPTAPRLAASQTPTKNHHHPTSVAPLPILRNASSKPKPAPASKGKVVAKKKPPTKMKKTTKAPPRSPTPKKVSTISKGKETNDMISHGGNGGAIRTSKPFQKPLAISKEQEEAWQTQPTPSSAALHTGDSPRGGN